MTSTILTGRSTCDLLAVPAVLFGFQPEESLVFLAVGDGRVEFGARLDLGMTPRDRLAALRQVQAARDQLPPCRFTVIGFSADPDAARAAIAAMAPVLGRDLASALVADGERYWELTDAAALPGPGTPYDLSGSGIAAQAVFAGLPLRQSRAEAVAAVLPPPLHRRAALAELLDEADNRVAVLAHDERRQELRRLITAGAALDVAEAATLACLLGDPDLMWAALARIDGDSAVVAHSRLTEARAVSVGRVERNVLGLLGLACWLAGHGAQQTECMAQLQALDAGHPLLLLLSRLHAAGTPPSRWRRVRRTARHRPW